MSRRGKNEGAVYKRGDGRWVGAIDLGYVGGKRKRKYYYGRTRSEVARKLSGGLVRQQAGLPASDERRLLGDFLDRWLADCVKPTVRPRTHKSYADLVNRHIRPELGHIVLVRLGPEDVQGFLNRKLASGLSARTVQYLHAVLRSALGQAERWELTSRNVARLVSPPRAKRPRVQALSADEARKFLEAAQSVRLGVLFRVTITLGLRLGEGLGLRWVDVDLDEASLTVAHALQRIEGAPRLVAPKSGRTRTLALPASIVRALREHRVRQIEDRLLAGARWIESGLVFATREGKPLGERNVRRDYKTLLRKAGLPPRRFHDLRHTAASLLLAQDVHPRVVMEILGHSQISLTMDTYSHVVPELQRDAAKKLEALLDDGKG